MVVELFIVDHNNVLGTVQYSDQCKRTKKNTYFCQKYSAQSQMMCCGTVICTLTIAGLLLTSSIRAAGKAFVIPPLHETQMHDSFFQHTALNDEDPEASTEQRFW